MFLSTRLGQIKNIPGFSSEDFANVNVVYEVFIFIFFRSAGSTAKEPFCMVQLTEDGQCKFFSIRFLYLKNKKKVNIRQLF